MNHKKLIDSRTIMNTYNPYTHTTCCGNVSRDARTLSRDMLEHSIYYDLYKDLPLVGSSLSVNEVIN